MAWTILFCNAQFVEIIFFLFIQAKTDLELLQSNCANKILVCEHEVVLLSSGKILARLSGPVEDLIYPAVLTFIGQYYLLDLSYPPVWWGLLCSFSVSFSEKARVRNKSPTKELGHFLGLR